MCEHRPVGELAKRDRLLRVRHDEFIASKRPMKGFDSLDLAELLGRISRRTTRRSWCSACTLLVCIQSEFKLHCNREFHIAFKSIEQVKTQKWLCHHSLCSSTSSRCIHLISYIGLYHLIAVRACGPPHGPPRCLRLTLSRFPMQQLTMVSMISWVEFIAKGSSGWMGEEAAEGGTFFPFYGILQPGPRSFSINEYVLFIAFIAAATCLFGLQSARALKSRSFITPLFAQVCFFARCSHNERFIPSS